MRIIDITRTAQDAPIYPGDDPISIVLISDLQRGDECNCSVITAGSHIGTHADAQSHYFPGGKTIDKMELLYYYGSCRVMTVPQNSILCAGIFENKLHGAERLILHTRGQSFLSTGAAEYITKCGIKTIVTDAWSVSPLESECEIHRLLLGSGVAIIENAVLDGVPDGDYVLSAFPIKYGGCDGAPVRAVLIEI